jgi:cell wall-associated NlpC family hydrolase
VRDRIVQTARSFLGVKFRHQGRSKEKGVDCAGLIICVGKAVVPGWTFDFTAYHRYPANDLMMRLCTSTLDRIPYAAAQHGDVLLLFDVEPSWPCHVGILATDKVEPHIIHALCPRRKVVEHAISEDWKRKIKSAFRYRGVP